ncbi:MAG: glycosyltransferase family 2 protein, partial [Acidobacteriota bacterium]
MPAGLVSVVFPAFNEEDAIVDALAQVTTYLEGREQPFEIVVADDGSTDRTRAEVEQRSAADPRIKLVSSGVNRGKGHAVRRGVLATKGDVVLFLDVDMSTPIEMMERVWPELDTGQQVVVGTRRSAGAEIEVHQPVIREALGDIFRRATRRLLDIPVSDITCGFKAFDGAIARRLFAVMRLDDWSFDVELLVAASQAGLRITEVPVVWRHDPGSKVRLLRDIPLAALGVTR